MTATATLVVSNVGRSVARNVAISFDPTLPEVNSAREGLVHPIARRYADPIPTLTPGMRLDNVWRFRGDADERKMAVPADRVVATATYEDTRGRTYKDRYILATDVFESGTYPEPGGTDEAAMLKRTAKALEAIARAVGR